MSKRVQAVTAGGEVSSSKAGAPKCLALAQVGIITANQFARFMSSLISDLIEGAISPQVGNAAVNAGGKLLKVVEMQYRYGRPSPDGGVKELSLIQPEPTR